MFTNLPRVFQIECPHYITVFTLARTMRWEETLSFSCWRILAFTSASSHKVQSLYLLSCPRPGKFLMWVPMLWSWTISEAWIGDATNIWHLWNWEQLVVGAGNLCAEHDIIVLVLLHAFCIIHSRWLSEFYWALVDNQDVSIYVWGSACIHNHADQAL